MEVEMIGVAPINPFRKPVHNNEWLSSKRSRRKPKTKFMDRINKDTAELNTENWKSIIQDRRGEGNRFRKK